MEKNAKIEVVEEIKRLAQWHPAKKHDNDHEDLWKAVKLIVWALNEVENRLHDLDTTDSNIYESLGCQVEKIQKQEKVIDQTNDKIWKLHKDVENMTNKYPKITTMKKTALLIDGENVLDTVNLESWRYLMVKYVYPVDFNEYAELDNPFSWETIEVTNWQYDVKIELKTIEEWETATMTANVDLLFVKY